MKYDMTLHVKDRAAQQGITVDMIVETLDNPEVTIEGMRHPDKWCYCSSIGGDWLFVVMNPNDLGVITTYWAGESKLALVDRAIDCGGHLDLR